MNAVSEELTQRRASPEMPSRPHSFEVHVDGVCTGKFENFGEAVDSALLEKSRMPDACISIATILAGKLVCRIEIKP